MKKISNIHLGIGAVLLILYFIYLYKTRGPDGCMFGCVGENISLSGPSTSNNTLINL
jgi:hypothetical protein